MNQPCQKCSRIITVPDIPLPRGYTQKCTACGYANTVGGQDLDSLRPGPTTTDENWDATFDSSLDIAESDTLSKSPPGAAAKDRFRELESRRQPDLRQGGAAEGKPKYLTSKISHHMVRQGDVLICTQNSVIYQKCFQILSELDYRVEGAGALEKALIALRQNHYQVIVIDQQFLNSGEAGRYLFQHIKETPTDIRRAQTVVLLTPGITTLEPQVFYQWSMDLNVHPRDLDRLGLLVRQLIEHKESILVPLLRT